MEYKTRKYRGKVVPNERQWEFLLYELESVMLSVQRHRDTSGLYSMFGSPLVHYVASIDFAEQFLLKKQAREFLALLVELAERIQDGRDSAERLVATFSDEDLQELPYGMRSDRNGLIASASGQGYHFHKPYGWEKNEVLANIVEHRERWIIEQREIPGNFGKSEIWEFLNGLPRLKKDHPPAMRKKVAWDVLKRLREAASALNTQVQSVDNLFAQLWRRSISLPGEEKDLARALEQLAKPLEKYTYTGGGWQRKYRHPDAQVAWAYQRSLDWTRDNIEGLKQRLEQDVAEIVDPLNQNFEYWHDVFQDALATAQAAVDKADARKKKKANDQSDLAEEPIRVPAFIFDGVEIVEPGDLKVSRILADPKALYDGLRGRHGLVDVMGIRVSIKVLRGWLQVVNQVPIDKKAIHWKTPRSIDKAEWLYMTAERTVERLKGDPGLVLVPGSQGGTRHVTTALAHFEAAAGEYVHRVQPIPEDSRGTTANEEMAKRHNRIYERAGKVPVEFA